MKLIIDPGALSRLQSAARVREHLAASAENEVSFSDFALQEAFNGATAAGLKRTFGPVQAFAPQVVCLKKTGDIARLSPRPTACMRTWSVTDRTYAAYAAWPGLTGQSGTNGTKLSLVGGLKPFLSLVCRGSQPGSAPPLENEGIRSKKLLGRNTPRSHSRNPSLKTRSRPSASRGIPGRCSKTRRRCDTRRPGRSGGRQRSPRRVF